MDIKERLMKCMDESGVSINESEEFEEIDSFMYITFIICLENEFQIEFPDEYLNLDRTKTISMFCNMIQKLLDNNGR